MVETGRKVVVIGAGIAGLCAAVYARRCGYDVEVVEQHDAAGGLATSWRRGAYTFETCLHWLVGTNPNGAMHAQWREVFDIDKLTFVYPEAFARLEIDADESLAIYSNADRMEAELLCRAPQDAREIRRLAAAVRQLAGFPMPDAGQRWPKKGLALLRLLPYVPLLRRWSRVTIAEYGRRYTHPLLRGFFGDGELAQLSALALVFPLAWMSARDAAYVVGGSQAIIRPIVERLQSLGGCLRLGAKAEKILVEHDAAVGVQLAGGERVTANWVISAADGHATVYDLLGGRSADKTTDRVYGSLRPFPSYVQVSLGVARDLSQQAAYVTRLLDAPLMLDPATPLREVAFRFFNFDPTFAPPGRTAVTAFLPTRNFAFWAELRRSDPTRYQAEKQRVAAAVIAILDRKIPGIRGAIEVVDVATPATVIRCTGNWQGSMEGWLPTPDTGFRPLRMTLPGLRSFVMVGQWVEPGGGLPAGLMTARSAIRAICRRDRVTFAARSSATEAAEGSSDRAGRGRKLPAETVAGP